MADANILVENSDLPGARQAGQINTKLPVSLQGSAANLSVGGNLTVTGTLSAGSEMTTSQVITATSANAFAVGRVGVTNPAFNVDTSTASVATGLNVKGAAAGGGLALSVITSGTNEAGTLDGAGSGTFGINTISTTSGLVTLGSSTSLAGAAVNGPLTSGTDTITSTSANALSVGANGVTNPVLQINASTSSVATGINITGAAAGSGVTLTAISSGGNESLNVSSKGTGQVNLQFGGSNRVQVSNTRVDILGNASLNVTGFVAASDGSSATAGGAGFMYAGSGATGVLGLYWGSGAPTVTAGQGSLYLRTDGSSTSTRLYVNTTGSTTWTNVTTAA